MSYLCGYKVYNLHTSLNKAVFRCFKSKVAKTVARPHKPGLGEMLFFLGSGAIVSIPMALFFEPSTEFLSNFFPAFQAEVLAVAILAPIIEEFAKAYPLFYRHGENQKSLFTLGFLVGLGFGVTEFFAYVLLLGVPFEVRLPGIFFHAALTSIVAYGIASRRSTLYYLVAVFSHFSVNLIVILKWPGLLYALILGSVYALCFILYTRTSERMIDY
jgi:RsiW-degrading membrane proteinase PrsW (M82 family)